MKKLKVVRGCDATESHLEQAVKIDSLVYPLESQGSYDTCLSWFKKNPEIYTFLIDVKEKNVVGYINAMPVSGELLSDIIDENVLDVEIHSDDILIYEEEANYHLYFSSFAIHPEYKNTKAFSMLYDEYVKQLAELANRNIIIRSVLAEGLTDKGARMCRLSGMEPIKSTKRESTLYGLFDTNHFLPLSCEAEKLKEFYMKSTE